MGFSFDGMNSRTMGVWTRMTTENRLPELRNRTIEIAGKNGLLDLGSSLSERIIKISCLIPPQRTLAGLLECKDRIMNWINPDKGLCPLILDKEPGRVYYARLQSGVSFEKVSEMSATFELTFFCPDPFGYAVKDEKYSFTGAVGDYTVTRHKGNIQSNPVYRLKGLLSSDAYISITTNYRELKIAKATLNNNETLVVDSEKMTAYVENEDGIILRNALPYLQELNFPSLAVGDNLLHIAESNAVFTSLDIEAKSRWR